MQLGDIRIEGDRDGTSYLSADFFGKTEGEAHASMLGDDGRGDGARDHEWQPDEGAPPRLEGGGLPAALSARRYA